MAPTKKAKPAEQIISAAEDPPNGVAGKHRETKTTEDGRRTTDEERDAFAAFISSA